MGGLGNLGKVAGGGLLFGELAKPAFDAGLGLIGQKYGADQQGHEIDRQNLYNRELANEMFNKQVLENRAVVDHNERRADTRYAIERADALSDWDRQNAYNSPAAQMQRLKEAGLNPSLMYTQGNVGNATTISRPNTDSVTMETAKAGYTPSDHVDRGRLIEGALQNYYRMRTVDLQTKNLAVQNTLIGEQARALKIENDHNEKTGGYRGQGVIRKELLDLWGGVSDTEYFKMLKDQFNEIRIWMKRENPDDVIRRNRGWRQEQSEVPMPLHVEQVEPGMAR